jgi:YggT family protein
VTILLTSIRVEIANYVDVLAYVYTAIIIIYIVSNWFFAAGLRIPYSRWSDAILSFLRDVSEPYLRIFRRFLPAFRGLDFSPIVAIFLLLVVASLISRAIRG